MMVFFAVLYIGFAGSGVATGASINRLGNDRASPMPANATVGRLGGRGSRW